MLEANKVSFQKSLAAKSDKLLTTPVLIDKAVGENYRSLVHN